MCYNMYFMLSDFWLKVTFTFIAVSVQFKRSSYSVSEVATASLMVILSNISSTDIILEVNNDDDSAIGMYSLTL